MAIEASRSAMPSDHRPPLSMTEAAEFLNVTPRWVKRAKEEGRLPYLKVGRHIRFDVADLEKFLAAARSVPGRSQTHPLRLQRLTPASRALPS